MIRKAINLLSEEGPAGIILRLVRRGMFDWMKDEQYIRLVYWANFKRFPNLKNPKTFNEKLNYLKIHDRKPEYTRMVDKYEAKRIVSDLIGEDHIIPTYGVWKRYKDIDFEKLPDPFVLKTTHDSGSIVICKNKTQFDHAAAETKLESSLRTNWYPRRREWPYKNVEPRIIAEKFMKDAGDEENGTTVPKDYKVFCFGGEPRIIMTVEGGHLDESKVKRRMYDPEWKRYKVGLHGKKYEPTSEPRPERLEEMLQYARILSKGMKHLRVDFYVINDVVYFGEMTFYHMAGMEKFDPVEYDEIFGDFLKLDL